MGLLDVNVLVALAWDSHVHHVAARRWFEDHARAGWSTSPVTEAGFVRVSSNPKILPEAISIGDALSVLGAMRKAPGHRFIADDVSPVAADVPALTGHRQVTDAMLLTLARRHSLTLVTFDAGLSALAASGGGVELLRA